MQNALNLRLKNASKEKLLKGLLDLLEQKDYDDITISEICQEAGVSRMAFYRNFEAKENILDAYYIALGQKLMDEEPVEATVEYANRLLIRMINDDRDMFRIYFSSGRRSTMEDLFRQNIENYILQLGLDKDIPEEERKLTASYCAGGVFSVLFDWVSGNYKEDEALIERLLNKLHFFNILK